MTASKSARLIIFSNKPLFSAAVSLLSNSVSAINSDTQGAKAADSLRSNTLRAQSVASSESFLITSVLVSFLSNIVLSLIFASTSP